MEDNPIKYSEFIEPDSSITDLIKQLEELKTTYLDTINTVKNNSEKLKKSLSDVNSTSEEGRKVIEQSAKEAENLAKANADLNRSYSDTSKEITKLKLQQQQQNNLNKLTAKLNLATEGSYNKLSAQYSLNVLKLNQMSKAQRENTKAGQLLQQQTFDIYQEMIKMQEATGKHTLSVGNYSKAYNGLSVSVNQLTRELPVLGMNLNTFFLAISNNIPMLADEINKIRIANKQALQEGEKAIPLGRQLVKAIFSWQTALSIGVALLTIYGKDLIDWIGKLIKGTDAIENQTKALEALNKARAEGAKSSKDELLKLELTYKASQDATRGREEQIDAIKRLKSEWPEYFENLTDEEILAGKAADTYLRLAESILKTAVARATENKIIENYEKIIDLQLESNEVQEKWNKNFEKGFKISSNVMVANGIAMKAEEIKLRNIRKELLQLHEINQRLIESIDFKDLFDDEGKVKEIKDETLDLLRKWTDTYIALIEDEEQKEVRTTQIKYEREIDDLKAKLVLDKNLTREGKEAINGIIYNLELISAKEVEEIRKKYEDKRQKESDRKTKQMEKDIEDEWKFEMERIDQEYDLELSRIEILKVSERKKTKLKLEAEKDRYLKILAMHEFFENQLSEMELETIRNIIKRIEQEINAIDNQFDIYSLFGLDLTNDQKDAIKTSTEFAISQLKEIADAKVQLAQIAVDAANREVSAAQKAFDQEIEARNNGYAFNVSMAQKELALAKKQQDEALKIQRRARKEQAIIEGLSQTGSLITASAKIWGQLGYPWAIPALGVMWGTFAAAKVKAFQLAERTYGEGGLEILKGGSHASGNDVSLGITSDGKSRKGEGGEALAIINRTNTRKYKRMLPGIIDALNKGNFEQKYMKAFSTESLNLELNRRDIDLTNIEKDVRVIRDQNSRKEVQNGRGGKVVYYKNLIQYVN